MSAIMAELDALRLAAGRTEAFASVAVQLHDDAVQDGRVSYVLGAVVESATAVVSALDRIGVLVADQQPAAGGLIMELQTRCLSVEGSVGK